MLKFLVTIPRNLDTLTRFCSLRFRHGIWIRWIGLSKQSGAMVETIRHQPAVIKYISRSLKKKISEVYL